MWNLVVGLLSLTAIVSSSPAKKSPTARVKNGTLQGLYSKSYNQDYFLGIPYAQAPVNDLRFRQAQSLNASWEGVREAKEFSKLCVGYGLDQTFYETSEDCLYLNIVRPAGYEGKKLPVGFWIHGGSLQNGGSPDQRYNLSFIIDQSVSIGKPIIAVALNYRLSLWGFASSNELAREGSLNIGLRDQRLALHWVQENIAAFGGDPKMVTIWGESAGAASVGFQLTAYGGRNDHVYRAAIMQSGGPIFYSAQGGANKTQAAFDQIVSQVGCASSTNRLQCLRTIPFNALNATMDGSLSTTAGFGVVTDGDFVQDYGSVQLSRGQFAKVPIIIGANSDEGASFAPHGINTTEQFEATLSALLETYRKDILKDYPDDLRVNVIQSLGNQRPSPRFGNQFRRVATYIGDMFFTAPARQTAQTWASHGLPTYKYRFNADQKVFAPELSVSHFKEIPFVFRNFEGVGFRSDIKPFTGLGQNYVDLAYFMSSTWASFIHDMDPNNWKGRSRKVPTWPKYAVGNPRDFVFEANVTSHAEKDAYRKEGMDLINKNAVNVYLR
ncbi:carboxylesterase family protein-like protein [Karstenula rhodostoma CBS 690.94]|uniref:Carboxylic ester hydrolase n=1 Tax=Karstenula rhodostoma CBS 690.94 TaxID=1392251 RepID=A0A9P4PFG7_9PLEO|nr:carboxylesterase family protein-like protein [Karstenula rhodostoma CBS 690.94]